MKKYFKVLLLPYIFGDALRRSQIKPLTRTLRYGIPQAPLLLDPATATDLVYYQIVLIYKNPQVDSLLEQARQTPDEPTQRVLYRRIQEIILQDVPAVFLSHPKVVYAIRDRVKNFRVDPLAIPWLNEVRLEDAK